jgi:hypothetical protein
MLVLRSVQCKFGTNLCKTSLLHGMLTFATHGASALWPANVLQSLEVLLVSPAVLSVPICQGNQWDHLQLQCSGHQRLSCACLMRRAAETYWSLCDRTVRHAMNRLPGNDKLCTRQRCIRVQGCAVGLGKPHMPAAEPEVLLGTSAH